eukprot:TRINITY_DN56877_c0_g1_i4.p1 TRINITY_DN56877_c0_g1~~TRINITY_DN56877_c0_g1_i4.p1  ORF type:complete len:692 (-),score=155.92 TRINITY_DN56877_c0_g1_i4:9-1862(-)
MDGAEDETTFLCQVISVVVICLPFLQNPRSTFLHALEKDLTKIICSKSVKVLRCAIPCLCILSSMVSKEDRSLIALFNAFNKKIVESTILLASGASVANEDAVCRCIFGIGLLVKHFDFEVCREKLKDINEGTTVTDSLLECLMKVSSHESSKLKVYSIETLFYLYSRTPRLMLKSETFIKRFLTHEPNEEVVLFCLRGLHDFLDSEELRLQYFQYRQKMLLDFQSSSKQESCVSEGEVPIHLLDHTGDYSLVASLREDNEEDNGIISGMLQRYIPDVIKLAFSASPLIRKQVLDILILILQQLRINPQLCIPSVINLCTDAVDVLRDKALIVFTSLCTKHLSLLLSVFVSSIVQLYNFQVSTCAIFNVFHFESVKICFGGISELYHRILLVAKGRTLRFDILKGLLGVIDLNETTVSKNAWHTAFIISTLGNIVYQYDEPLLLLHEVNTKLAKTQGLLENEFSLLLEEKSISKGSSGVLFVRLVMSWLVKLCRHLKSVYEYEADIRTWSPFKASDVTCTLSGEVDFCLQEFEVFCQRLLVEEVSDGLLDSLIDLFEQFSVDDLENLNFSTPQKRRSIKTAPPQDSKSVSKKVKRPRIPRRSRGSVRKNLEEDDDDE